ncbi:unnamed protein product [Schistosoma margrebowiei]|uniref:Uncharacterized protein n=1 Tax=Schistosoma margrebowiei TaxID=48269 RepID=A0A3P8AGX3_9TREM|nr:unnamed protein product [Schistosoma margrebowiei]
MNAHEVVTIPDDQEPDPVDEARSPELNEALLVLSSSENEFQLEQNYGPRDNSRESYGDSYSENNCSDTMNPIIQNVTQNHCETEIYIESACPISNDKVSDMGSQNNACYFDEISYKNEENISAESNYCQKSNLILLDDDFHNDPFSTDEIPNGFESNASEELNFDFKSKVVHYHLVVSSGSDIQCEKRRLNKVLLFVTWRYPTFKLSFKRLSAKQTNNNSIAESPVMFTQSAGQKLTASAKLNPWLKPAWNARGNVTTNSPTIWSVR